MNRTDNIIDIAVAGCKDTTLELMNALTEMGFKPGLLLTIDAELAHRNKVAGYTDLKRYAADKNIECYSCSSYSLNDPGDVEALSAYNIKILLVNGWQRLIPVWLLNKLQIGAFGMHGSSRALPYGRGRSPMNWSLIQNKKLFITNLFKYDPGVDDGDIVGTIVFDINEHDDARTMHYKNTLSMIKLLKDNLPGMLSNRYNLQTQLDTSVSYYPKRTEEDGIIFWHLDTEEIYNLIRAVTKPFSGAFTFLSDEKIIIWKANPFDSRLFDPYIQPGTVLHVFLNGDFIVKTGNGSIIVSDYSSDGRENIIKGVQLHHKNYSYKNIFIYPAAESK